MLKALQQRRQLILLLSATSMALRVLSAVLVDINYVWEIVDLFSLSTITLCSLGAFLYVPYEYRRIKCLLLATTCSALFELILSIVSYSTGYELPAMILILTLSVLWLTVGLWYFVRPYDQPSIPVQKSGLYLLQRKPESIQDICISMCCFWGCDGGFAWYDHGKKIFYGYRKGFFESIEKDYSELSKCYNAVFFCQQSKTKTTKLEGMIGEKWSLFGSNCLKIRNL